MEKRERPLPIVTIPSRPMVNPDRPTIPRARLESPEEAERIFRKIAPVAVTASPRARIGSKPTTYEKPR